MKTSIAFKSEFCMAILSALSDGKILAADKLAETVLGDKTRATVIRDCVRDCLEDETEIFRGQNGGIGLKGALRSKNSAIHTDLTLSDSIKEQIEAWFTKFGPSLSRGGIALSFIAGKLTDNPNLAKQYEGLVAKCLDEGLIPRYHVVGRTVKPGNKPKEEVAA